MGDASGMRDYNGLTRGLTRRALLPTLVAAALVAGCAHAPVSGSATPANPTLLPAAGKPLPPRHPLHQKRTDLKTADLAAQMRSNAPLRYVVKPGDTLWDIAGYYLRDPWYWPQLWYDNPGIANPHLIYPGEVLVLSRGINGTPHLHGERVEHLSPTVRQEPIAAAIPTIPYASIRNFLTGPRLVAANVLTNAPYIVSFLDQRLVAGAGALAYVRGIDASGPRHYAIVHPDGAYRDSQTGAILGRKALPVGQLTIQTFGPISTAEIESSDREALIGDRLLPIESHDLVRNFHPHAPARTIRAHIISVYGGVSNIGQHQVVTLDRGEDAGFERGDVLEILESGRKVVDPVSGNQVTLPSHRSGELMIFKTDQRVSFALIMRATRAIHIDDLVRSPTPL